MHGSFADRHQGSEARRSLGAPAEVSRVESAFDPKLDSIRVSALDPFLALALLAETCGMSSGMKRGPRTDALFCAYSISGFLPSAARTRFPLTFIPRIVGAVGTHPDNAGPEEQASCRPKGGDRVGIPSDRCLANGDPLRLAAGSRANVGPTNSISAAEHKFHLCRQCGRSLAILRLQAVGQQHKRRPSAQKPDREAERREFTGLLGRSARTHSGYQRQGLFDPGSSKLPPVPGLRPSFDPGSAVP